MIYNFENTYSKILFGVGALNYDFKILYLIRDVMEFVLNIMILKIEINQSLYCFHTYNHYNNNNTFYIKSTYRIQYFLKLF